MDSVTRYVPMEVHHLALVNLKPNSSYSCVVEMEGLGVGRPCHFITNGQNVAVVGVARAAKMSQFRSGYNHMAASILLGGVLPMMLIGGCVGAIILTRKYQSFQRRKEQFKKYHRHVYNVLVAPNLQYCFSFLHTQSASVQSF